MAAWWTSAARAESYASQAGWPHGDFTLLSMSCGKTSWQGACGWERVFSIIFRTISGKCRVQSLDRLGQVVHRPLVYLACGYHKPYGNRLPAPAQAGGQPTHSLNATLSLSGESDR